MTKANDRHDQKIPQKGSTPTTIDSEHANQSCGKKIEHKLKFPIRDKAANCSQKNRKDDTREPEKQDSYYTLINVSSKRAKENEKI